MARRSLLQAAVLAAAVLSTHPSVAQIYPTRPVRIIVPYSVGGGPDIVARLIAQWLSERLGQPFFVENRPGAGANIGTEAALRAPADGYTLLLAASTNAVNSTLYEKLNFNFVRDIAPIAMIGRGPEVMVVNPALPAKTVPEFMAYAKSNPGKISIASTGIGSISHVVGELFKSMTGLNMVHVPYRGAQAALTDLIAGQVQVMFDALPGSIGHIQAGELRALAVTTAMRWESLPQLATMGEFVPGFEASAWSGVGAPKNTSPEIVDKLNKEVNAALDQPQIRARISNLGGTTLSGSPADFGKLIAEDTEKWGKVIRAANIKAE
jgi:tripartite-type tricarboxylate transporter receptor subunit TctC